jgi:hypothetical protein
VRRLQDYMGNCVGTDKSQYAFGVTPAGATLRGVVDAFATQFQPPGPKARQGIHGRGGAEDGL